MNRTAAFVVCAQAVGTVVIAVTALVVFRRPAEPGPPQPVVVSVVSPDHPHPTGPEPGGWSRDADTMFVQYPGGSPQTGAGPVVKSPEQYRALLYGAGFAGGAVTPDDFAYAVKLLEEIVANGREMNALLRKGPGAPQQATADVTPAAKLAVAKQYCAACHTPSKADTAGGGWVMFADDAASAFKPVSAKDRQRESELVRTKVEVKREMPPAGRPQPKTDEARALSRIW